MIYLDSAATSLLKPKSVSRAVARAIDTMASPGRGAHRAAMLAADTVFDCRSAVAELFDVPEPEQVVLQDIVKIHQIHTKAMEET